MAEVLVKNNLNPNKSVKFGVSIRKIAQKNFAGEEKYFIEVGTTHSGIYDGNNTYSGIDYVHIRPKYIDIVSGTIDTMMSDVIGELSTYIDWGPLLDDIEAPYVSKMSPVGENVSIYSNVNFTVTDNIPTTGVDLSEMKVEIDTGDTTFDITDDVIINGNPFEYNIMWQPPIRELNV